MGVCFSPKMGTEFSMNIAAQKKPQQNHSAPLTIYNQTMAGWESMKSPSCLSDLIRWKCPQCIQKCLVCVCVTSWHAPNSGCLVHCGTSFSLCLLQPCPNPLFLPPACPWLCPLPWFARGCFEGCLLAYLCKGFPLSDRNSDCRALMLFQPLCPAL